MEGKGKGINIEERGRTGKWKEWKLRKRGRGKKGKKGGKGRGIKRRQKK